MIRQPTGGDKQHRVISTKDNGQTIRHQYTGLFVSPSGTSELDCATKKERAERSIPIGRESLKVFFVLGALAYL